MRTNFRSPKTWLLALAAVLLAWTPAAMAQAETPAGQQLAQNSAGDIRERMNNWTIGLASSAYEGAPARLAAELARVLDDGDEMRVIPFITRGTTSNINDLLYLRGVDAAIVYADVLSTLNNQPDIKGKVNYIASLFPAEVHILARADIQTLEDLRGKTVNCNSEGTAASHTAVSIFNKLNLDVKTTFLPHPVAMKKMVQGENIAAVVLVSSKPLEPFLGKKVPAGYHFIPIPYSSELQEFYLPSFLTNSDYPDVIPNGEQIQTIAVPAVLAAFDWPRGSDRYRRMERFVHYLFTRLTILQNEPGYHPLWKDVNLAGKVTGWNRFPAVQAELDKLKSAAASNGKRGNAQAGSGQQERLYQEFQDWKKEREKR